MSNESNVQTWPHKKDIFLKLEINPAKREKVIRKIVLIVVGIIAVGYAFSDNGPLKAWVHDHETRAYREALEPTMRQLADQGQASAIIWLSQNIKNEDPTRLRALADAGNGEALFTLAWTEYATDEPVRESLINRAADAGVASAIRMVQSRQKIEKSAL